MLLKSHALALACATFLAVPAFAADAGQVFATPQDALEKMIEAMATEGDAALLGVFGSDAQDLITTGNPLRDAENRAILLQQFAVGYRFQSAETGHVHVLLGADGWRFPVPLVRGDAGWRFDVEEGRDEVLSRRIGLNELDTMEIMYAYVEAQAVFRLVDHDNDGVMEFAAGILPSEPGARDGLFWRGADSLMGELIALAALEGDNDGSNDQTPTPFGGYYYRVLSGQGADAPGGEMNYAIGGHQVAGHALLAVPAEYGNSGIHSFLISENGILFEADLGEDSVAFAREATAYNPGEPWMPVE